MDRSWVCTATKVLHVPQKVSLDISWFFNFSIKQWDNIYLFLFHFCVQVSKYRSVLQIPPFCNLSPSTKRKGGLCAGCDIFSRDYALPSGAPPTTCPDRKKQCIWRLCSCYLEGCYLSMWQSHVEIEGYSVAYFDHIAVFEALYRWTSVKGELYVLINLQSTREPRP